jgi:hypothetical protein
MFENRDLWESACHEAAHGAFAIHEMNAEAVELTLCGPNGGGLCAPQGATVAHGTNAVFAACGLEGTRLGKAVSPPQQQPDRLGAMPPPITPDWEGVKFAASRAIAQTKALKTDGEVIAEWACGGSYWARFPSLWHRRARRCRAQARQFVRRHQAEILNVAQKLYSAGYTVERNPTQNGG